MNTFETSWPEKFVSLLLLFLLLAQFLFFLHVMDVVMFLAAWWWTSPTCFKPDRIKLFQTGVYLHEWQHSSACQEMNSHRAFSCDDFPQRPLPHPKTAVLWTTWSCCGVDFMSRALSKWSFTTISSLTPALSKLSRHLPYTRRNLHFSRIKYYKLYSSTNSLLHLKAPPVTQFPGDPRCLVHVDQDLLSIHRTHPGPWHMLHNSKFEQNVHARSEALLLWRGRNIIPSSKI